MGAELHVGTELQMVMTLDRSEGEHVSCMSGILPSMTIYPHLKQMVVASELLHLSVHLVELRYGHQLISLRGRIG